jgi:hypothetical protein
MKKIYIIMAVLLCLTQAACYKDKSNTSELVLPDAEVTGIEKTYSVYTYRDFLKISPVVKNEDQYDFYWILYSTNFNVNAGLVPKGDTVSRTKTLNYEVLVTPGQYILVFSVRNKATTVTKLISSDVAISTLNMNGWYLLKDNGTTTDFDFIYTGGRIDNWMAYYNDGKSMTGKSIKAIFAPGFKQSPAATETYNALAVISDNDAGIYRIDNGKKLMEFDNMFFTKPAVKKPQNIFQPTSTGYLQLINDGDPYFLTKGALFSLATTATNYRLSPVGSVAAGTVGFDELSKSMITFIDGTVATIPPGATYLRNMDASLVWTAGYAGLRSIIITLFKKANGEGRIMKLNGSFGYLAGYSAPIVMDSAIVPATHGLMRADLIAGNHDADYLYYVIGSNLYLTGLPGIAEQLQLTLPAGETVTCMQHIKYPAPASGVTYKVDYLAIATYANGRYKVWLQPISSIGTIQPLGQPNFEGQGRVSCINYLEQGNGSRVF